MTQARTALIVVAAMLLTTFCAGVSGQAAAPGPASSMADDCMTYLVNASDCLTYVTSDSTLAKPDKGCCPEVAGLVESNPVCLCYLLGGQNSFGIEIDVKKALKLPSICKVTTPPVSMCSVIGITVGAPTSSGGMGPTSGQPSTSPSGFPSMSMSPDAGAVAVPPSTLSEASCNARNALTLLFGLVFAFISV